MTAEKIRIGGIMRCCLERFEPDWPDDPKEGDTLDCPHGCGQQLVFYAGAFEWYRPDHPLRTQPTKQE